MTVETSKSRAAEGAHQAVLRFYRALDELSHGRGPSMMYEAWHHIDQATTVHPYGHWSVGWAEVSATWAEIASLFSTYKTDGVGDIHELRLHVVDDESAYTICHYRAVVHFPDGPQPLNLHCTNVLLLRDGEWKVVHHHPDQAPLAFQEALTRMIATHNP